MQPRRISPHVVTTDLQQINRKLEELKKAEEGDSSTGSTVESKENNLTTPTAPNVHELEGADTLNENSTTSSECSTPVKSNRPGLSNIRRSSLVQVKKEENKTWYRYPRKGYKVTTKYMYQEIDNSWTALMLIACYFVSGLTDSAAFNVWNVFVSMQTGNTIFLALRVSGHPVIHNKLNFIKCLTSIGSYCVGALIFNLLHRVPTDLANPRPPLHRWTLLTSFVIQSGLLIVAAILAQTSVLSRQKFQGGAFTSGSGDTPGDNFLDLIGIGLLAFEAAGQVCLSRVLLVNELPTIVLSTLYHDLIGETLGMRKSWQDSDRLWDFVVAQKRQLRRLACIISLFCGALIGGFIFSTEGRLAGALWLASGVKICICVAWCVWKKKLVTETVVTTG